MKHQEVKYLTEGHIAGKEWRLANLLALGLWSPCFFHLNSMLLSAIPNPQSCPNCLSSFRSPIPMHNQYYKLFTCFSLPVRW